MSVAALEPQLKSAVSPAARRRGPLLRLLMIVLMATARRCG
jgi:hypothetical protein